MALLFPLWSALPPLKSSLTLKSCWKFWLKYRPLKPELPKCAQLVWILKFVVSLGDNQAHVACNENPSISALTVRFLTKRYIGEYDHQAGWSITSQLVSKHSIWTFSPHRQSAQAWDTSWHRGRSRGAVGHLHGKGLNCRGLRNWDVMSGHVLGVVCYMSESNSSQESRPKEWNARQTSGQTCIKPHFESWLDVRPFISALSAHSFAIQEWVSIPTWGEGKEEKRFIGVIKTVFLIVRRNFYRCKLTCGAKMSFFLFSFLIKCGDASLTVETRSDGKQETSLYTWRASISVIVSDAENNLRTWSIFFLFFLDLLMWHQMVAKQNFPLVWCATSAWWSFFVFATHAPFYNFTLDFGHLFGRSSSW